MRSSETNLGNVENKVLTKENIEAYIEGCEDLAMRLDTAIEKVIEAGKRPVILIPSRGAVPIFLLARRFMNELRGDASYLASKNAKYYPKGVFDYLEGETPQEPDTKTTADVVLFPFTADVSAEVGDDETLARDLRNSCARSVMQIIKKREYGQYDYSWYQFLVNKLAKQPEDPSYLDPKEVVKSLSTYNPGEEDTQIILIDTVISGRAANDITNAFKAIGHTVIPILAVDSTKGGKLDNRRKSEIEQTLRPLWEANMVPEEGPFVNFPLITEDEGAALLGLVALNFINFNEPGIFHKISKKFDADVMPQSCVWTLPPKQAREKYLGNFREFINLAWRLRHQENNKQEPSDNDLENIRDKSKMLTSTHDNPSIEEINSLVNVGNVITAKESASHIISIKLADQTAKEWIQEFSSQIK